MFTSNIQENIGTSNYTVFGSHDMNKHNELQYTVYEAVIIFTQAQSTHRSLDHYRSSIKSFHNLSNAN